MNSALNIVCFILLIILTVTSAYTARIVFLNYQKPAVVWLIPNDASCGDIWTSQELRSMSEKYELRIIE